MKYRKIPIVVDAYKFTGMESQLPDGVYLSSEGGFKLMTLEGPVDLAPTDVIVTGLAGERWCVKASIFKRSYEPVSSEASRSELYEQIGENVIDRVEHELGVTKLSYEAVNEVAKTINSDDIKHLAKRIKHLATPNVDVLEARLLTALDNMESVDRDMVLNAKQVVLEALKPIVKLAKERSGVASLRPGDTDTGTVVDNPSLETEPKKVAAAYVNKDDVPIVFKRTQRNPPDTNCCFGLIEPTYLNESCDGFKWPTGSERPTGPDIDCPPCATADCTGSWFESNAGDTTCTDPKHGW